jgi:hypothetical protein
MAATSVPAVITTESDERHRGGEPPSRCDRRRAQRAVLNGGYAVGVRRAPETWLVAIERSSRANEWVSASRSIGCAEPCAGFFTLGRLERTQFAGCEPPKRTRSVPDPVLARDRVHLSTLPEARLDSG